jgi:hypothetical protein
MGRELARLKAKSGFHGKVNGLFNVNHTSVEFWRMKITAVA